MTLLSDEQPNHTSLTEPLLPSQALTELAADPEPAGKGRPLPGSLTDAPNAAAVEALAMGA
ncbi:hypothetical protein [Streptomyces sp. NPDC056160]|uniref:hypothetical protein n=1 Tax=Streptomyces sp. NPDC056160 TaxID=3345731 RepID=UPI0035DE2DC7